MSGCSTPRHWVKRVGLGVCLSLTTTLVVLGSPDDASATPSSAGLVAHWSFDQSSGTVLTDNSGNGHNGTVSGAPTWGPGRINNALTFHGNGEAVSLGNLAQINNVSQLTLATWIKRSSTSAKVEIGKQTSGQDVAIEAWNDGKIYFQMSKGSDTYATLTLNDIAWHHIAMVFDGTLTGNANRLKAYVDGVQKTLTFKGTVASTTTTSTTPFYIGRVAKDYSKGQIDDTWLYARALSQADVQDLIQPVADTAAPSIPANPSAASVSSSQITLSWSASTDSVGVAGYRVFRDGAERTTTAGTSFQDTGLAASTTYSYTVRAYDAAGNQSADSDSASATTAPVPPVPSVGLTATPSSVDAGGSSTLSWTSADATSCVASGGWSGTKALTGSETLNGLVGQTTYVLACAGPGGQANASALVSAAADQTAPSVSLTAPSDGATVSGAVVVAATATDNVSVAGVTFTVDGVQQGSIDTLAPYGISLDSTSLGNGAHAIRATASDSAGNSAYAEITVSVDNQVPPPDTTAPQVSISNPSDGASVSGTVTVTAAASDDVGVSGVTFYAGGAPLGTELTAAPYAVSWNTTSLANGSVPLTAVARDAAGHVTTSTAVNVTVNNVVGARYVTGVAANGRSFMDQTGAPILIKGDSPWAMFSDLSPAQVELWAADRESHGFNAAIVSLVGSPANGGPAKSGATYDGILPFNGGDITSWNPVYWARMDSYLTILKNHGITAFLYPMDGWNTTGGTAFSGKTNANAYTYGQMVATRYAGYPNIVWLAGGDYNGYSSTINGLFQNMLSGIRSTGDNRPFSIQLNTESVSTQVATYEPLVKWNFAYSYSNVYDVVLSGYGRAPSSRDPRPVVLGESNYEGENNTGGLATTNETLRRQQLWALTSGSAGDFTGSQDWLFSSGWQNRLDTPWITQAQKIRNFFASLSWQLLVPDVSAPLVTAGRGTRVTGYSTLDVLQDDYVTAAQTPDRSLSLVYVPTNTGNTNARTITLNLSRLPTSYTASWVDPTDATLSQAATIDASGQATTPGTHADGSRDWLLVVRG